LRYSANISSVQYDDVNVGGKVVDIQKICMTTTTYQHDSKSTPSVSYDDDYMQLKNIFNSQEGIISLTFKASA